MLDSWYPEFVHIHVFMGIHETINNYQEDLNTKFVSNFILLNYKNIAYKACNLRLVLESFEAG